MMHEVARLEQERADADARYNDALTALDREISRAGSQPGPIGDELRRLGTALIVFLQQITAFIDTKDRQVAGAAAARVDERFQLLEAVPELRAQVGVLQRAVQMLKREFASGVPRTEPATVTPDNRGRPPAAAQAQAGPPDDFKYLAFEDRFRGADEDIEARLRSYLPLFTNASSVLDVGCGRGEFLALLQAEDIVGRGVDSNREMVAVARGRGFDAVEGDALAYLLALPDETLGGLIAVQVVEHLEPGYLLRLLETASEKLQPGAPIVIETINPACWLAFFSSYIRDFTHVRPLHPDTLQYLLQASGFDRVSIRYSAPAPEPVRMKSIALPADTLAAPDQASRALVEASRVVNANAAILNNLLFSYLDYAAIGYRA
jgi:SAM-dependent methyltransferase